MTVPFFYENGISLIKSLFCHKNLFSPQINLFYKQISFCDLQRIKQTQPYRKTPQKCFLHPDVDFQSLPSKRMFWHTKICSVTISKKSKSEIYNDTMISKNCSLLFFGTKKESMSKKAFLYS